MLKPRNTEKLFVAVVVVAAIALLIIWPLVSAAGKFAPPSPCQQVVVCGSNGVTYGTPCSLPSGVRIAHYGSCGMYENMTTALNGYIETNLMSNNKGLLHAIENSVTDPGSGIYEGHDITSEGISELICWHTFYGKTSGNWSWLARSFRYMEQFTIPNATEQAGWDQSWCNVTPIGGAKDMPPYLMHWYIDAYGDNPGYGSIPRLNDTMYKTGENRPCYNNSADWFYSEASDADLRAAECLWQAWTWTGNATYLNATKNLGRFLRYTFYDHDYITRSDIPSFGVFWKRNGTWCGTYSDSKIYVGYQDPATAWQLSKLSGYSYSTEWNTSLTKTLQMMSDAQAQLGNRGPWYPAKVYSGGSWSWSWESNWAGWDYWLFARLAQYYYLSKDTQAKTQLDRFYNWMTYYYGTGADGTTCGSMARLPGTIDTSGNGLGLGWDLGSVGAAAQGSLWMWAATKNTTYRDFAENLINKTISKCSATGGGYVSTDGNHRGWHEAEFGRAMALHDLIQIEAIPQTLAIGAPIKGIAGQQVIGGK